MGTGIMAGICTSHTQLKKSGISHTHTHTQSMRGFSVKTGTGSDNTHGDGFICHLYKYRDYIKIVMILTFEEKIVVRTKTNFYDKIKNYKINILFI